VCVCVLSNQIHWPIFLYFICNVFILYIYFVYLCLGDGNMLCVWDVVVVLGIGVAGVCNCELVSVVFVCDAVIHGCE